MKVRRMAKKCTGEREEGEESALREKDVPRELLFQLNRSRYLERVLVDFRHRGRNRVTIVGFRELKISKVCFRVLVVRATVVALKP